MSQENYPFYFAPLMSLLMYAGAGQFLAVGLLSTNASFTTFLIAQLVLNLRHIFYGFSLINKFQNHKKLKPYLIFTLTDETYSLLNTIKIPSSLKEEKVYFFISFLNHLYWITGTILGSLLGIILSKNFNVNLMGIDFSLNCLFAVLFIEQILNTKEKLPIIIGICSSLISIILWKFNIINSGNNVLLYSILFGIGTLLLFKRKHFYNKNQEEINERQ